MKKVAAAAVALATFVGGFSIPAANALPTQQDERKDYPPLTYGYC